MKDRTIKLSRLMLTGPFAPELLLVTAQTAAEMLEVHEKHVFRLLAPEGPLQRVTIVDGRGRQIGVGVTLDSVEAYRKSERRARKRQLDLLSQET